MKIDPEQFRVRQGNAVDRARWPTTVAPLCTSDAHYAKQLQKHVAHLSAFPQLPQKNGKFSTADIQERKFWPQYMAAYAPCLDATGTRNSPWYVVPADDTNNPRLIVSHIVRETFERMPLAYPKTSPARRREWKAIRAELAP